MHYVNSGRVTFFLPLCTCPLSHLLLAKRCQDIEVGWSTFCEDRRKNDGRWDWGIRSILQHDHHIGVYNGWGSDLEVHLGGNFGLEGPGFLSYLLNYKLLLSSTYSEYSKHRSFLMHHLLWNVLQRWGYVQKLLLLCLVLSCYGGEQWGVWIADHLVFLPFSSFLPKLKVTTHPLLLCHISLLEPLLLFCEVCKQTWGLGLDVTLVTQTVVCVPLLVHQPLFTGTHL